MLSEFGANAENVDDKVAVGNSIDNELTGSDDVSRNKITTTNSNLK